VPNEVIDCLMNHRSIRKFKEQPVEEEVVQTILAAGTRAATAGNLQLYTLILIEDRAKKLALGVGHAPLAIAALADHFRVKRWFEASGIEVDEEQIAQPRHLFLSYWDAIIALQTVVVAAESLGLGTCYYGGILSADVAGLLGAPKYTFPAGLVAIGYPDEEPQLSVRLPLEAVVHRDRYREPTDDELKKLYEERERVPWNQLTAGQQERLKAKGIDSVPKGIAARKYSPEFAQERSPGVITNLNNAGFKLA
jgi:nitroreductase